jgi:hypothetical protein
MFAAMGASGEMPALEPPWSAAVGEALRRHTTTEAAISRIAASKRQSVFRVEPFVMGFRNRISRRAVAFVVTEEEAKVEVWQEAAACQPYVSSYEIS